MYASLTNSGITALGQSHQRRPAIPLSPGRVANAAKQILKSGNGCLLSGGHSREVKETIMNNYFDDMPSILNASEIKTVLRISKAQVYNLLHSKSFPTLHIGSRLMVSRENLMDWIAKNTNNSSVDTFDGEAVS